MRTVRLTIGFSATSIWLNGEEVIGIYGDRQTVIDDGVSQRVTLAKGLNTIRPAVINAGGATDFCARFLRLRVGAPHLYATRPLKKQARRWEAPGAALTFK